MPRRDRANAKLAAEAHGILEGVTQELDYRRPSGSVVKAVNTVTGLTDFRRRRASAEHIARIEDTGVIWAPTGDPLMVGLDFNLDRRVIFELWNRKGIAIDAITGKQLRIVNQAGALEGNFDYLSMQRTGEPLVPLLSAEGALANNLATQESPTAGSPAAFPWKTTHFSTTPPASVEYLQNVASPGTENPGPEMGITARNRLRLVKTLAADDIDGFWYYRFISALGENTAFNTFARAGMTQIFHVYVSIRGIIGLGNPTPAFWVGYLDPTASTSHRAKYTFNTGTGVMDLVPSLSLGEVTPFAEDMGNGYYHIAIGHRSNGTDPLHERRCGIYMDAGPADVQLTRELDVVGFALEERPDGAERSSFYFQPKEVLRTKAIKSTLLVTNKTKSVAMTTKTSGVPKRVTFITGPPADHATLTVIKDGVTKVYGFDATPPFPNPQPDHIVDTATATTNITSAAAWAAFVNTDFGAGTARVVAAGVVDVFGVLSITEAGDSSSRIDVKDLYEMLVDIREPGYGAEYFVAFKQGSDFLKAAAISALDLTATGETLPNNLKNARTVGYTIPTGKTGPADAGAARDLAEKTSGSQDFYKGIYFAATATGGVGQVAKLVNSTSPEQVAQELAFRDFSTSEQSENGILAKWTWTGVHTVEVAGSVIRLASTLPFDEVRVADSFGGDGLLLTHGSVDRFSLLPKFAQDQMRILVKGNAESKIDDYWVEFDADTPGAFGPGKWRESTAPSVTVEIDRTTMPHQFVLLQDGASGTLAGEPHGLYIEYGPFKNVDGDTWTEREVGSEDLQPNPLFVGNEIASLQEHQGRLVALTGQSLQLSEVNRVQNWFRTTLAFRDPRDPFGFDIGSDKAYDLAWAHSMDRMLLVGDRQTIYAVIDRGQGLSIDTAERRVLLNLPTNDVAAPAGYGRSAFLACDQGSFSGIIEIFPSAEGETANHDKSTKRVPAYIEGRVLQMGFCIQEGIFAGIASGARQKIWTMHIEEDGGERILQAWGEQDLGVGARVTGVLFYDTDLYLTAFYEFGPVVLKIPMRRKYRDKNLPHTTHLDRRCNQDTLGYTKAISGGNTIFKLPYRIPTGATPVLVNEFTGEELTGTASTYVVSSRTLSQITVSGDHTSPYERITIGFNFDSEVKMVGFLPPNAGYGAPGATQGTARPRMTEIFYSESMAFLARTQQSESGEEPDDFDAAAEAKLSTVPGDGSTTRIIITGVPNNNAEIVGQRVGELPLSIVAHTSPPSDSAQVFYINTTTNGTVATYAQQLSAKILSLFRLPSTVFYEAGRATVEIPKSGQIVWTNPNDPANEIEIQTSPRLEQGRHKIVIAGRAEEASLSIRSSGWKPFGIEKVGAELSYADV